MPRHKHMHTRAHTHTHTGRHDTHTHTCAYTHTHTHTHADTSIHRHTYTYTDGQPYLQQLEWFPAGLVSIVTSRWIHIDLHLFRPSMLSSHYSYIKIIQTYTKHTTVVNCQRKPFLYNLNFQNHKDSNLHWFRIPKPSFFFFKSIYNQRIENKNANLNTLLFVDQPHFRKLLSSKRHKSFTKDPSPQTSVWKLVFSEQ